MKYKVVHNQGIIETFDTWFHAVEHCNDVYGDSVVLANIENSEVPTHVWLNDYTFFIDDHNTQYVAKIEELR